MSKLPKRDKLDLVQASAIDFVVAQEGNVYIKLDIPHFFRTQINETTVNKG